MTEPGGKIGCRRFDRPVVPVYLSSMEYRSHFSCVAGCEGSYSIEEVIYRCPKCGELLEVRHDIDLLRRRSPSAWIALFDERVRTNRWPYGSGVWGAGSG